MLDAEIKVPAEKQRGILSIFQIQGRVGRAIFGRFIILDIIILGFFSIAAIENESFTFLIIMVAILLWPTVAVTIKRCHDRGYSGWRALWYLVPVLGLIIGLFDAGFAKGESVSNKFGPIPSDKAEIETYKHVDKEEKSLKNGFSWRAFFFSGFWAFYNGLIGEGLLLLLFNFLILKAGSLMLGNTVNDLFINILYLLFVQACFGWIGNDLIREKLITQGYFSEESEKMKSFAEKNSESIKKLFSFKGRTSRKQVWIILGVVVIFNIVCFLIALLFRNVFNISGSFIQMLFDMKEYSLLIFSWPLLATFTQRYHDRDKNAGWIFFCLSVPYLGILSMILECGFLRGQDKNNRFGISPLKINRDIPKSKLFIFQEKYLPSLHMKIIKYSLMLIVALSSSFYVFNNKLGIDFKQAPGFKEVRTGSAKMAFLVSLDGSGSVPMGQRNTDERPVLEFYTENSIIKGSIDNASVVQGSRGWYVATGKMQSKEYPYIIRDSVQFSPRGNRIFFSAMRGDKMVFVLDFSEIGEYARGPESITFTEDDSHYRYVAYYESNEIVIVVDSDHSLPYDNAMFTSSLKYIQRNGVYIFGGVRNGNVYTVSYQL